MLPIQPIGERTAITQVYGATASTTVEAPLPPGVAVDVTPYGQLLGTLALAQQRFGDLASGDGTDPNDIAQLGIGAGELAEAFNLGRALPLPGQATLPDQLTDALGGQQRALAGAGIDITPDGRLNVDSRRLLAAYERDRQGTLKALEEAARRFAEAGTVQEAQQQNVAAQQDVLEQLQLAAQQRVLRQQQVGAPDEPEPSDPIAPKPQGPTVAEERQAAPEPAQPTLEERAVAARLAAQAAQRRVQELAVERQAIDAAELARRQQEERVAAQVEVETVETDNVEARRLADQRLATQRLADQRLAPQRLADQRLADNRLADQQSAGTFAATRQMDLTQEARQAARRLDVARDMVAAQAATQEDIATQDQRLAEARAAALRQLTSSAQEDDAAQALADRLARERDAAAQAAQADDARRTQERLDAARREAMRSTTPPAMEESRPERFGSGRPADAFDTATLAGPDDMLDDAVVPGSAARPRNASTAAANPPPPNAADPAMAAAIAAQRLAGGIPGGAQGSAPQPPPRTQPVPPVAAVAGVTAAEGSRTKPRGGT